MCVICASPRGVRQPTRSEIKAMFMRNPDGAGYMAARGGIVTIHKGFMSLDELLNALRQGGIDGAVYRISIEEMRDLIVD